MTLEWPCHQKGAFVLLLRSKTKNDLAGFIGMPQQPGAIQNAIREAGFNVAIWPPHYLLNMGTGLPPPSIQCCIVRRSTAGF